MQRELKLATFRISCSLNSQAKARGTLGLKGKKFI